MNREKSCHLSPQPKTYNIEISDEVYWSLVPLAGSFNESVDAQVERILKASLRSIGEDIILTLPKKE